MGNDAYPELADLNIRLQELEHQGYTVFPEYLDRDTTAAIRAHIDSLVGPHCARRSHRRQTRPAASHSRGDHGPLGEQSRDP